MFGRKEIILNAKIKWQNDIFQSTRPDDMDTDSVIFSKILMSKRTMSTCTCALQNLQNRDKLVS